MIKIIIQLVSLQLGHCMWVKDTPSHCLYSNHLGWMTALQGGCRTIGQRGLIIEVQAVPEH